jgi:hypothetical protein
MEHGPVEVVVIAFPADRIPARVRLAVEDLVTRRVVRVVDALVARRLDDGSVVVRELEDLAEDVESVALDALLAEHLDLFSDEDAEILAAELRPGQSALALAFEQSWLSEVRSSIRAAGGEVLVDLRVPAQVVDDVLAATAAV